MRTTDRSLVLVLSAPSGAGKTTLARMLLAAFPGQTHFSISHTTRAPRGAERDGVDYHFVDEPAFRRMIEGGQFVEWAEVYGHFYGSSRTAIERAETSGGIAVFDIDLQGGNAIKRAFPEAVLVYILPPSFEELERRLRSRGTDAEDVVKRRLSKARSEIELGANSYDFLVINDELDAAFDRLRSIVVAQRCRRGKVDLASLGISAG